MSTTSQKCNQLINARIIIKLLFPAVILFSSFKLKSGDNLKVPVITKEIAIKNSFQSINISGDISVVLTNKPAGTVLIEGTESDVNRIRYRNKNNELIIDAGRKKKFGQLTIYLSAFMLKHMLVSGDGHILSLGVITTDDLHIWLNGDIDVNINTTGKVSVDAYNGYDLFWKSPLRL